MDVQIRDKASGIFIKAIGCLIFMLLTTSLYVTAQEEDKTPVIHKTNLGLTCIQKSNETIDLEAKLRARINKKYGLVEGASISFYALTDSSEVILDNGLTGENGIAVYKVIEPDKLPKDTSGYITILAKFDGNDTLKSKEKEFVFKKAVLTIVPGEEDSVKTLAITAKSTNGSNETPIEEADVFLYVPRLFSLLKVAEETTDDRGEAEMIFPDDLPGNEGTSELNLIARVEDTDDFGTLETVLKTNWGLSHVEQFDEVPRALWSIHPPIWMLITFIVMITVVWGHFLVIIINLYQIKRESSLNTE